VDRKFIIRLSIYLTAFLLLEQIPLSFLQGLKVFTADSVTAFWGIFSPVSSAETSIDFIGFPMVVTLECTAIHYMTIYASGVLAYTEHSLRYRATGLFMGCMAIYLLNILRIGVVGYVGYSQREYFDFVHAYLWQGSFALVVFMFWAFWIKGAATAKAVFSRQAAIYLGSALAAAAVLVLLMQPYAAILSWAADVIFSIVPGLPHLQVVAHGADVGYVLPEGIQYNRISKDVMSAVIFFSIAAGTFARGQSRMLVKRLGAGSMLLVMEHLFFVLFYGALLSMDLSGDLLSIVLYSAAGISLAAPILIWLVVSEWFSDTSANVLVEDPD